MTTKVIFLIILIDFLDFLEIFILLCDAIDYKNQKYMAEKSVIEGELRVKDILREKGMKMYELAEKIGVAPESLTRALQRNPQYSTLKAIANALGVHIRELFREEESVVPIVRGMVELKGKILYIDSLDDIYHITTEVEKVYEELGVPRFEQR